MTVPSPVVPTEEPGAECVTCHWLDAQAEQARQPGPKHDPSQLTDINVLRERHRRAGECPDSVRGHGE
jgi:hypothetical protein